MLDGSFTESDPYNCELTYQPKRNGTTSLLEYRNNLAINFSLEITAFRSLAYISCEDFLNLIDPSPRNNKVNFSGMIFSNMSIFFIDFSVLFVHCSFVQNVNPIKIAMVFQQNAIVSVKSSMFLNNVGCIRVELSKSNMQVAIDLNDVSFKRNRPFSEHEGSGISIYSTWPSKVSNVNVTVTCKKTVFSYNIGPLITNNATFSKSNELYQHVKFLNNYVYAGLSHATSGKSLYFSKGKNSVVAFDDFSSTGNTNIRCVEFNASSAVQLKVFNSHISGHVIATPQPGAGLLITAVNLVEVFINESSFNENVATCSDGAVVALNSVSGSIRLRVRRSSFIKNSAQNGGAFSVMSQRGSVAIDLKNVSFQSCLALNSGGAFSITANRKTLFTAKHSTWVSGAARRGSAIFIEGHGSNTAAKLENCRFIDNVDVFGNFFVLSSIGSIEVSKTEWSRNRQGFYIMCNCDVNFTEVNVTSCNGNAFNGSSLLQDSQKNRIIKLQFERCSFHANQGNDIYFLSLSNYLQFSLSNVDFGAKKIIEGEGYHALKIEDDGDAALGSQIAITNVQIENFVGAASITLQFNHYGANNTAIISNCTFHQIRSYSSERYHAEASPLSIVMPHDDLSHNICSRSHLSYQYRNAIIIENTSFTDNIGRMSGGVYLNSGNITILNCTFENNFAIQSGGHIHITDGSATVKIINSRFKQSSREMTFANEAYVHDTSIYSESTGSLILQKTLVTTDLEKDSYRLFSVTKAGMVKFDNFTRVQCAVGSALRIDNFSHFIVWPFEPSRPCKLKMTVITLSCHQCSPGLYSLKRGEVTNLYNREDSIFHPFKCISCPNGANCSRNIFAKPNYWGYSDSNDHGLLKFVHCPPHYCNPSIKQSKSLSVYNRCYGNRDGIMCGSCKEGYTETLFSKKCKPNEMCKDKWIWFLMFIYVILMALFLIYQPPIMQILVKNILWLKKEHPNIMEYQPLDRRIEFDSGYTRIVFYFYQIASYLTLESIAVAARKAPYVSFFIGLFNFQTRISRGSFGCPFPGLTVVTKELVPALLVIATLFSIQVIFILHLSFNQWTGRPCSIKARYYGATLKTLLLGYATLANTSLKLLTCVPVLGESRLYYDGNIKCLSWWQYVLIIFIVAFLLPFVVVIYWGAMKLRRKLISVEHFIGSCFFPLGFILFWLIQKFSRPRNHHQLPDDTNKSGKKVLKVLHDPFRPPRPCQYGSFYWESVLIGRRFLLLSLQVFFPDPLLRLFFMDMTCLLVFAWHMTTKPFRDWKANIAEAVSLATLVAIATINLVPANFRSAGVTPQGPMKRNLNVLMQIEIFLLGIVPLLLALLCVFAVVSQVVRLFLLIYKSLVCAFRRLFRFLLIRRMMRLGQYEPIN